MDTRPIAVLPLLLSACSPRQPVDFGAGSVVTLADYFETGERKVAGALVGVPESAEHISVSLVERASRSVVRVRIHHNFHGDAHSTSHATGTLVNAGKYVATVAHEMVVARENHDARIEIVLFDRRVLGGRMQPMDHYHPSQSQTDWAVLEVVDPPADISGLEIGAPANPERVVLGFPGRYGRDADGHVVLDDAWEAVALRPLRIICRAPLAESAGLDLEAGCVPIGGMSGAPCIDGRGHLVAIQRAVTDTFVDGHDKATLEVVKLEGLRAALVRLNDGK